MQKSKTPLAGPIWLQEDNTNKLGKSPLDNATCKISKLWVIYFCRRILFDISLFKSMQNQRSLLTGLFRPHEDNLNNYFRSPLGNATSKISMLLVLQF